MYAVGVVFGALGIGLGFGAGFSPVAKALLVLPLQFGVVLFRAGTDSLIEREELKVARYMTAGVIIFGIFIVLREVEAARILPIRSEVPTYILPRILMGVSYAWAAWPLRTLARRRWAEGHALMAGALVCLSARMFASAGYEVMQAENGEDALSKLDGSRISLVICDVNMPQMDGITFVREIKKRPSHRFVPVVMLTTEASEARKQEGQLAGAKAWVV